MSESKDLAKQIIKFLGEHGWTVWQNNSGQIKTGGYTVHLSPPGYADIIGHTGDGRFVNIEVKIGADTLNMKQAEVLRVISKSHYGICYVARYFEDFKAWYFEGEAKGFYRGAYERQTNFDTDNAGDSGGGE